VSFKDKMEIGLKPDAPYRPDNRPASEQPTTQKRKRKAASAKREAPAASRRPRSGK
jgi:hypothetical protein